MKRIIFLVLISFVLVVSAQAHFGSSPFSTGNILTTDLEVGTNSIDGDASAGLAFDPDNDGVNEVTMPAAGGINIVGSLWADSFKTDETTAHTVFVGDDAGGSGTYSTFAGEHAGQSSSGANSNGLGYQALQSNTGAYSNGVGYYALQSNTGSHSNGVGHEALRNNTGAYSNGVGHEALRNNTGASSNGVGHQTLYSNTGASSNGMGYQALRYNTGAYSNGVGHQTLYSNTGASSNGMGYQALRYNSGTYLTAFGDNSFNTWTNTISETVDTVIYADNDVTITGHGFGGAATKINLIPSTTGALPAGLDATPNQWTVVDANTLSCNTDTFSDAGTGTLTLHSNSNFTNSTALGYNAEPTASNQVMLGDTNVTQVKSSGALYVAGATVAGTTTLRGATNNCILTVDADGTCDAGTAVVVNNSIAICAVCAAN